MLARVVLLRVCPCVVVIAALAGCSLDSSSGPPELTNSIVFMSSRHGTSQLYVMRPDGSQIRQLTTVIGEKGTPAISPDGKRVAFVMHDTSSATPQLIYVVNSDGSGLTQLTTGSSADFEPSWSPDGSQIAFSSLRNGPNIGVWVMNSDGRNARLISPSTFMSSSPSWSPISNKILISVASGGTYGIFSITPTGDSLTFLVAGVQAQWSPTGTQFLYECGEILCISRTGDGSSVETVPILTFSEFGSKPKWSPDEQRIVSVRSAGFGQSDIWTASAIDGSGATQITHSDASGNWFPDWSRH